MNAIDEAQQITIDRRPLWIVIFDRMRRLIFLALLFALFVLSLNLEGPRDLSPEGYKVLCLFLFCVSLWTTNLIPLSITSMFAIAAIPLLGIMGESKVYAYFGNKAVFFILGAFILSAAMIACGLSVRLSLWVLNHWGKGPRSLVLSVYFFGAVGSCVMSEHAVAAMLFPIVLEIVNALKLDRKNSLLAKSMFFAMAWGCIIGGITTVLGGGRAPLMMEILEKGTRGESSIGIMQYTQLTLPLVFLLLICGWIALAVLFPPEISDIGPAREVLRQKSTAMGKVTFQEKGVAAVMLVTLFFWFRYGEMGIANIAFLSVVALFALNLTDWKKVDEHVNWAVILMYGGAICLANAMEGSGAALWLAKRIFAEAAHSEPLFLISLALLALVFTSFMNDSAVVAVLLPPALSLSQTNGISATLVAMTVVLNCNFAFILPVGTPASALAYSSRFISLTEMAKSGAVLGLMGVLCYAFLLFVYWPFLGFN